MKARESFRWATVDLDGVRGCLIEIDLPEDELPASLSASERAIVALVLEGCTTRGLAERRGTSTRTITTQLASIYRKLGVSTRLELQRRLGRQA